MKWNIFRATPKGHPFGTEFFMGLPALREIFVFSSFQFSLGSNLSLWKRQQRLKMLAVLLVPQRNL